MRAPQIGRSILFTLSEGLVEAIRSQRLRTGDAGNAPHAGDVVPGEIVKVWPESGGTQLFNARLSLDGVDVFWATSVQLKAEPTAGYAHWWDWDHEPRGNGNPLNIASIDKVLQSLEPRPSLEGSPLSVGDVVFVRDEGDEEYTVKALGVLCEPEGVGATIEDSAGGERTMPYEGLSRECPKVEPVDQGLPGPPNPPKGTHPTEVG